MLCWGLSGLSAPNTKTVGKCTPPSPRARVSASKCLEIDAEVSALHGSETLVGGIGSTFSGEAKWPGHMILNASTASSGVALRRHRSGVAVGGQGRLLGADPLFHGLANLLGSAVAEGAEGVDG